MIWAKASGTLKCSWRTWRARPDESQDAGQLKFDVGEVSMQEGIAGLCHFSNHEKEDGSVCVSILYYLKSVLTKSGCPQLLGLKVRSVGNSLGALE
eukprot:s1502_g12.t1